MRSPSLLVATVVAAGGLLAACGLNQKGVPPFGDAIFFPGSALVDPGDPEGRWLYVANSNSDLRYNDGTLVAVDIKQVDSVRGGQYQDCSEVGYIHHHSDSNAQFCCWDLLDRNVLNCDERQFIDAQSTIRIGSFAAGMVWQDMACPAADPQGPLATRLTGDKCRGGCDLPHPDGRLFIGVRGNSSLTYVDVTRSGDGAAAGVSLDCGGTGTDLPECADSHLVKEVNTNGPPGTINPDPTPTLLPDEPYALTLDPNLQLLYVGHLRGDVTRPGTGGVSLFDVSNPTGRQPTYLGPFGSFFPGDGNGLFGITSLTRVAEQLPDASGAPPSDVYATSRFLPRVAAFVPGTPGECGSPYQTALFGTLSFDTTLVGSEVRGIAFLKKVGNVARAYVLQRVPPALIGFDLGDDPLAPSRFSPTDVIETCSNPTFLQKHDPGGAGERLFVTCFETGQVYVVDPTVGRVTQAIDVGRGPAGLAFGPGPGQSMSVPASQWTRAYVVGFGDNNISVVDLVPGSPTQYHVIMRLGFPSTVPR